MSTVQKIYQRTWPELYQKLFHPQVNCLIHFILRMEFDTKLPMKQWSSMCLFWIQQIGLPVKSISSLADGKAFDTILVKFFDKSSEQLTSQPFKQVEDIISKEVSPNDTDIRWIWATVRPFIDPHIADVPWSCGKDELQPGQGRPIVWWSFV